MSNQHVATAWLGSSPEAKRQQLDSAIEYALEQAILERPEKPLQCMAQKLRDWDDAVNGSWPLKSMHAACPTTRACHGLRHPLTSISALPPVCEQSCQYRYSHLQTEMVAAPLTSLSWR
jgi:hypothetical protein